MNADETVAIKWYRGSESDLIVPEKLNGHPMTGIGDRAFSWRDSLQSITMPDGLTSVGDQAFYNCKSLQSITLSDTITSIGKDAFKHCSNLTLTVHRDSYAATYAKENNIPYTYPDALDWLND